MTKATVEDVKNILQFYWKTEYTLELDCKINKKLSHADVVSCCRLSNDINDSLYKINTKINDCYSEATITDESPNMLSEENSF